MMGATSIVTREALKKVFKKGAKSITSSQIKQVLRESPKKLFRYVDDPKDFLQKGFQPGNKGDYTRAAKKVIKRYGSDPKKIQKELVKQGHTRGGAPYKEPGLKWSASPLPPKEGKTVIQGIKRPGALTSGTYDPKGKADFIQEYIQGQKVLQQKPGNVLAFVKQGDKYLYRVLGLTAAVGVGTAALSPEEAEAGVISDVLKKVFKRGLKSGAKKAMQSSLKRAPASIPDEELVKRVSIPKDSIFKQFIKTKKSKGAFNMPKVEGPASSASKRLVGTEYQGKTITKVTVGQGDHRYLSLDNGDDILVDKSFINKMSRKVGTDQQVDKFISAPREDQLIQAYKALKTRMKKGLDNKDLVINYFKSYKQELKMKGVKVPPTYLVEVEGKYFTLPERYAKLLKNQGAVKLIKKL